MRGPARPPPRPRLTCSTPGMTISSTCRKPFLSRPMSTKAASRPGQDVVDDALVDVADDRAASAALEVDLGDAVALGDSRRFLRRAYASATSPGRRARPAASSMATRVSPRSTVTSTCFLKMIPHWKTEALPLRCGRLARLRVDGVQEAEGQER